MENKRKKKDEEYAAEFNPQMVNYRLAKTKEGDEDGLGFFRGIFFGVLLAIPLWALIIWAFTR